MNMAGFKYQVVEASEVSPICDIVHAGTSTFGVTIGTLPPRWSQPTGAVPSPSTTMLPSGIVGYNQQNAVYRCAPRNAASRYRASPVSDQSSKRSTYCGAKSVQNCPPVVMRASLKSV